jgi:hypothetical protein
MMAELGLDLDPIPLLRAPQACEAITTSGWAIAEAIRVILRGNPHFDSPGVHAALERLELYEEPIVSEVAPYHPIMLPDGGFQDDMEWCLPDSWVNVMLPDVEGLVAYFASLGVRHTSVGVERRFVNLIEDPGDSWPWVGPDLGRLIDLLGLEQCSPKTT